MSEQRRRVSKVTDEELLAAAADAPNMRQLLRALGIAAYGGNYASIRSRLERLGGLTDQLRRRPQPFLDEISAEAVASAIAEASTLSDALRALGHTPTPRLLKALSHRARLADLDMSHLVGRAWSRGRPGTLRVPLEDLLVRGSAIKSHKLKLRLLREGVMQHVCACCMRSEWRGRPIPLELDHIDGDATNNELSNLRLLCPNCHAQTDTYRGRNIGRPHRPSEVVEGDVRALAAARERLSRIVRVA